jgi:hypothetical protein
MCHIVDNVEGKWMVVMKAFKICISICVIIFALSFLFGYASSNNIKILGTWVVYPDGLPPLIS